MDAMSEASIPKIPKLFGIRTKFFVKYPPVANGNPIKKAMRLIKI